MLFKRPIILFVLPIILKFDERNNLQYTFYTNVNDIVHSARNTDHKNTGYEHATSWIIDNQYRMSRITIELYTTTCNQ